jgi:ATP-dependent Clp protease ATP-binding subunit ClpA
MFFERFTEKARTVVVLAQQQARERGDDTIDTEHLLRALFAVPDNLAVMVLEGFSVRRSDVEADLDRERPAAASGASDTPSDALSDSEALAALGIDLDEVRRRVEEAFGPGALDRVRRPRGRRWGGHTPFAKATKKALELALREAIALRHNYIGTEHLLLGMLRAEGVAREVLTARGVRLDAARVIVEELVRGRRAG